MSSAADKEERNRRILELWADGKSQTEVAQAIGGITKNIVAGVVHRAKIPPRPKQAKKEEPKPSPAPKKPAARKPASRPARLAPRPVVVPPPPPPKPEPAPLVVPEGGVLLVDLVEASCRFVVSVGPARFCGRRKAEGQAYCLDHVRLCYVPREERGKALRFIDWYARKAG